MHPLIQTVLPLRAQVQQGHVTREQALESLTMSLASSAYPFKERSAPQQLPPGNYDGGVPRGNAHRQMGTLSHHAQVSSYDQMNPLRRAIQTQHDASHLRQLNMPIHQGPQLQNDSGLTSRMPSNPSPLRMDLPRDCQGPGSMQEIYSPVPCANVPSSSTPSATQPQPEANSILDLPLSLLRALSTHLLHVVMEGEKTLQATGNSGASDIQRQQLRAKIELNKQRLRAFQEVINAKVGER